MFYARTFGKGVAASAEGKTTLPSFPSTFPTPTPLLFGVPLIWWAHKSLLYAYSRLSPKKWEVLHGVDEAF